MASERYQRFKARIQRFQFILVLGFAVAALGAVLVAPLMVKLGEQLAGRESRAGNLAAMALSRLWVYAVMPAVAYAAARLVPLVPWPSAVGLVLVGEAFYVALDAVTGGMEAVVRGGSFLVFRLLTAGVGVVLTALAIRLARRHAESSQVLSDARRSERAGEYQQFLKEAERLSDLKRGPEAPQTPENKADV